MPPESLHANVLGKFLVHEGAVQHLSYMQNSGVLLSYGADGNLFVLDLRVVDLKALGHSVAGQALAKVSGLAGVAFERARKSGDDRAKLMASLALLAQQCKAYKMSKLTPLCLPKPLSNAPADWAAHLYRGDNDLVLVRNSEYESILQEIRDNSQDVKRMERTAEYQMSAQKDFYLQNLKALRTEMEGLLQARESELATTKNLLKLSESEKAQAAQQHKMDVAELNTNWRATLEKKLHENYVQQEKKAEEMRVLRAESAAALAKQSEDARVAAETAQADFASRESGLQTRIAELELTIKENEVAYEEAMTQMEGEHDVQVLGLERSSAAARMRTREGTAILHAEVSAAKRKLDEKNEACKALEALANEREDQLQHLSSVIRRLTAEMASLKQSLREKEEHITRRQHELAQARQDNGTLKSFLEILESRIVELENRETPALDTMLALRAQVESMSEELVEMNKAKLAAQNLAVQKQGESTRFASTANNLRHKLAKKEHAWESVQKELKYIVGHLGNGAQASRALLAAGASGSGSSSGVVNIHVDLKNLYQNFFAPSHSKSGPGGEPEQPDRSLIEKVENEATRQRNFLEKSLKRLRHANTSLASRTKAEGEKALGRAIHSLYEINRLREENQRLYSRCGLFRSMVVQAGLGKKLDLIDAGDEGGALAQIEEEHKQQQREHRQKQQAALLAADSATGGVGGEGDPSGRKRLMARTSSLDNLDESPAEEDEEQIQGSLSRQYSSGTFQQQRKPSGGRLAGSQSSALLPAVNGTQRTLRDSQSTPALPAYESGSDYLGGNDRPMTSSSQRSGSRGGARATSPQRGSTRQIAEQAQMQNRAAELERRLEQVNQHVSLQQLHISALQTAIRNSAAAGAAAQAAAHAQQEAMLDEQFQSSGGEGSDAEEHDEAASSAHFFPPAPVTPGAAIQSPAKGQRSRSPAASPSKEKKLASSASRGKLSPLRKSAASASQPQQQQQLADATLRGSNVTASASKGKAGAGGKQRGGSPPPAVSPSSAIGGKRSSTGLADASYSSMQRNIDSALGQAAGASGAASPTAASSSRSSIVSSAAESARSVADSTKSSSRGESGIAAVLNAAAAAKNKKQGAR